MENCRQMKAMIQKLHYFEVQKIDQILCVKRYLFTNPFTFKEICIYSIFILHAPLFHLGAPEPPKVQVIPSHQVTLMVNNFKILMRCLPDQHDLHYVWEKRNDNLPSRAQGVHSSTLTIINLKPEDSGEYRCVVSNSTGRIASNYSHIKVKGTYLPFCVCYQAVQ